MARNDCMLARQTCVKAAVGKDEKEFSAAHLALRVAHAGALPSRRQNTSARWRAAAACVAGINEHQQHRRTPWRTCPLLRLYCRYNGIDSDRVRTPVSAATPAARPRRGAVKARRRIDKNKQREKERRDDARRVGVRTFQAWHHNGRYSAWLSLRGSVAANSQRLRAFRQQVSTRVAPIAEKAKCACHRLPYSACLPLPPASCMSSYTHIPLHSCLPSRLACLPHTASSLSLPLHTLLPPLFLDFEIWIFILAFCLFLFPLVVGLGF